MAGADRGNETGALGASTNARSANDSETDHTPIGKIILQWPELQTQSNEDIERHTNRLSRIVSGIDYEDAKRRYEIEAQDNQISLPHSSASSVLGSRKQVTHWEEDDPENPYNWSSVCHYSVERGIRHSLLGAIS